jgi:hypothetical protein
MSETHLPQPTPFEVFQEGLRKVLTAPKAEVEKKLAEEAAARTAKRKPRAKK